MYVCLFQSDGRPQAPKIQSSRPSPEHAAGERGPWTQSLPAGQWGTGRRLLRDRLAEACNCDKHRNMPRGQRLFATDVVKILASKL